MRSELYIIIAISDIIQVPKKSPVRGADSVTGESTRDVPNRNLKLFKENEQWTRTN